MFYFYVGNLGHGTLGHVMAVNLKLSKTNVQYEKILFNLRGDPCGMEG